MRFVHHLPHTELSCHGQPLDQLLDYWFGEQAPESSQASRRPPADIREEDDQVVIHVDMPGVDSKSIQVQAENNILTLSGERQKNATETDKNGYYHQERIYGRFERSFRLPDGVDSGKIVAAYRDGVLEISVPKTEATKAQNIDVQYP